MRCTWLQVMYTKHDNVTFSFFEGNLLAFVFIPIIQKEMAIF